MAFEERATKGFSPSLSLFLGFALSSLASSADPLLPVLGSG